jgi:mono/diheme cytochrome c family protein
VRWHAAIAVVACSGTSYSEPIAGPALDQLAVGSDVALIHEGGLGYAFEPRQVSVLRGTQVVGRAVAPGQPWTAATSLAGPDGERWVVGLAAGALWRVTSTGDLEPIGPRLGIGDARVLALAGSATGFVLGLAGGVAFARDGVHLERYAGGDVTQVAIASARVAIGRAGSLEVFDLEHRTRVVYPISQLTAVAFAGDRLVAVAGGAAYAEDGGVLRRVSAPDDVGELAVSGSRIWLAVSGSLYALDGASLQRVAALPGSARIHAAGARDVWVSQAGQSLRYSLDAQASATDWRAAVGPVFKRACAKCHLPDGAADLDLSTPSRWTTHAAAIHHMVATHAMPPPDAAVSPLSEDDRQLLLRWPSR